MPAKRRADQEAQELMEAYINGKPLPIRLWMKMWRAIYYIVSTLSYVLMLIGIGFSFYFGIINPVPIRALMAGLFTVLIIYVNKVNPS